MCLCGSGPLREDQLMNCEAELKRGPRAMVTLETSIKRV